MYYVYVLKNKSGKLYKGYTGDLVKRLKDHNDGKNSYTRNNGPWELIYKEKYLMKTQAMRREKFLKTGKGRLLLKNMIEESE